MTAQTADREAQELLIRVLSESQPLSFTDIAERRGDVKVEAIRRAIWLLVEAGNLAFTADRRIELRVEEGTG